MRARRIEWEGADATATAIRSWATADEPQVDVAPIESRVREGGDAALLELTARFDATEQAPASLRVDDDAPAKALDGLDPALREALELAIANVSSVAAAQIEAGSSQVSLPQGQSVELREICRSAQRGSMRRAAARPIRRAC